MFESFIGVFFVALISDKFSDNLFSEPWSSDSSLRSANFRSLKDFVWSGVISGDVSECRILFFVWPYNLIKQILKF